MADGQNTTTSRGAGNSAPSPGDERGAARITHAPGSPGLEPTWTSSDKDLVGTALGSSRLWFTLGHGIVNEVYYPRIDIPQIRDLGFIVADDAGFWVEVKRLEDPATSTPAPGVPLPVVVHRHPRFTLTLKVCPDPGRDVLLLDICLEGDEALRPYVLLAPHLGATGHDNRAWVGSHGGRRALLAEQGPFGLALLASRCDGDDAFGPASAGYVGTSDGWQDFKANARMTWRYGEAGPGNVALLAECTRQATLALGLGTSKEAAATLARSALLVPFDHVLGEERRAWQQWHCDCPERSPPADLPADLRAQFAWSAQVLKTHSDKTYLGAMVASLSVPWGNRGEERGGYHLVWPRDLVESAQALLALGALDEARASLAYLLATQQADGHWVQNQWLGGEPYWTGLQLDETALPVLLAAQLAARDALGGLPVADGVRRALRFLIENGPASPQDRWEEDEGVNPFTLGTCIAALVAGAELLPAGERELPLVVADWWNARLEDWCVARDSEAARMHGIRACYVRAAPPDILCDDRAMQRALPIKNRAGDVQLAASGQVGPDFLQLVRLGLRRPDDPLVRDTLVLIDALLKTDLPQGPVWHRYVGDGYGEHDDGSPFDGTGRGRGWPLLTGERGHYELAAGRDPLPWLRAMNAMASHGLIPEQVWDAAPRGGLRPGQATGSARPLAWAHAEFIKLVASRAAGAVSDRPASVWQRYGGRRPRATCAIWTPGAPIRRLAAGEALWIVLPAMLELRWGVDLDDAAPDRIVGAWRTGLGLHVAELAAADLAGHDRVSIAGPGLDPARGDVVTLHIAAAEQDG